MTFRRDRETVDPDLSNLGRAAVELAKRGVFNDEAVHANQGVLDVDPENVDALLRLLRCRMHRSEYFQAADLIERLDALGIDDSDRTYVDRFRAEAVAKAAEDRGRWERERTALQERRELLASARTIPSAQEAQALGAAYRGKDTELAIAFLERGLKVAATWEETLSVLAVLAPTYRDAGDLPSALAAYERAIEIEPDYERNRVVYTSWTATLRRIGRLDDARRHGEELDRRFPDDSFVLNALGAVYVHLSVRDRDVVLARKAEDCFLRAAERDPGARDNLRQLRTLISKLGDLCELLEEAGDTHSAEAVKAQRLRVEQHLARLTEDT
jgi:tetratricopeptide (TPR) repeat protein